MSVSLYGSGQTVVQVQSTTITSFFSTNSTSFVDITGLSVSITPQSTTSKILVLVTGAISSSGSSAISLYNLVRSGSNIYVGNSRGSSTSCSANSASVSADKATSIAINYLDSPSTTSAITYKLQMASESGSYTACIGGSSNSGAANNGSTPTTITVLEISGS